ncbi:hypothetical protein ACFS7Z_20705 [Pontibacter toksunensis]|uniref:Adhesin domain-containing protein n=1 Tax=Pontibacter toksunensis TaxID=1332631 RepID=A0ABW6C0I5_9BACT
MKKMMILALLVLACVVNLQAQPKTVERTLQVPASNKINLQLPYGNEIKITAWDKKEASIKATYEINGGRLNDAMLLDFESDDKSARVQAGLDFKKMKTGSSEDCPQNGQGPTMFRDDDTGNVSYTCTDISFEIFVPHNAELTVETQLGNIELKGLTGPVSAKSMSGYIDMNWPQEKGAVVSLKTITGEVYSDVDLALANKEKASIMGYQLKGKVNEGGTIINLESMSNHIYFRNRD